MSRFLPVLFYTLAAVAVLVLAGIGAAGNLRGMVRYLRTWFVLTIVLMLAAMPLAVALN
jgi:hypothetical protein